jgi:hypothetical protein
MGRTDARAVATHPTLATSREFFAAAVVILVVGYAVILKHGWVVTRIDIISAIVALGALVYSFWLTDSERLIVETAFKRDEMLSQFAVFVVFLAFYAITAGSDVSPFNAHVRQAFAFIHGHTYIDAPNYIEHAQIGPYSYQLHPILPAILLMPFAAIWGMNTNQNYFSIVVGALDMALAWRLLGHFHLTVNARKWLTVFFGAGTIIWYETVNGGSWGVSMVVAVLVTLIALDETFDKGRPAIVGFFAGIAGLARYDLVFVWPVYLALLLFWRRRSIRELFWFIPGCALTAVIYITFNFVRYHSPFDRGVVYYMPKDQQTLFAFRFFPGDFFTLFFMAPGLDGNFPYIHPTFGGQSILTTSPAFLLTLKANCRRFEAVLIALGALIAVTPSLFYVGNGSAQFGTRHYLQAFPFLLILMALGVHRRIDQMSRILITASVFMIAWGVWYIRFWGLGA